ncbi:MAG: hypothetical protein ACPMAQ_03270 [Phycisphaerae bacterium]
MNGAPADIMALNMWRLAAPVLRLLGFASLTLLATSLPPSARPAMPLSAPERTDTRTAGETPLPDAAKGKGAGDPALIVSVDLGNIWHRIAEVRAGNPTGGEAGEGGLTDGHHGSTSAACLPREQDGTGPVQHRISAAFVSLRAMRSARAFFTADRAQAPPCA